MKQFVYAGVLMLAALTSCSKDEMNTPSTGGGGPQTPVYTRISASLPQTRTTTDDGFNTLWNADDAIGLFAPEAYCEYGFEAGGALYNVKGQAKNLNYTAASGSGSAQASFTVGANNLYYTGNFAWNASATNGIHNFYAYHPFREGFGAAMKVDAVPVTLSTTQIQQGADSKAHIGAMDFMYASLQMTAPEGTADKTPIDDELGFSFTHAFALMEFTVTNSTDAPVEINKIVLNAADKDIAGDFTFDLTDGSRTAGKQVSASGQVSDGITSRSITLLTKNADDSADLTLAAGASAKVYMVVNPVQLTDASVQVETSDGKGQVFTGTVTLTAGNYYKKSLVLNNLRQLYTLTIVDFEDVALNAGGILQETTLIGEDKYETGTFYGYTSNGLTLRTFIGSPELYGPFWCGFTFSNKTDMTTVGYENQYSVYGTGGHSGSKFAVGYEGTSMMGPGYETQITLDAAKVIDHLYMTNGTYAALSMKQGDDYAKKHSYEGKDWFKVTVTGYNETTATGSVDVYLSDFRTADAKGVVESWKKVNLSALGAVTRVEFKCSGSDVSSYGLNTPSYFCIDDIAIRD